MPRTALALALVATIGCSSKAADNTVPPDSGGIAPSDSLPDAPPARAAMGMECTEPAQCATPAGRTSTCVGGFPGGYCSTPCDTGVCPEGSGCFKLREDGMQTCLKQCAETADCGRSGYVCSDNGACIPSCATSPCRSGFACNAETGRCDRGKPGAATGPFPVAILPDRDCTAAAGCGKIVAFEPVIGPGYNNYPLNGETATDQYRSFCRLDLQMLVKWATAYVDQKSKGWTGGNGFPLGLGDMSEVDGNIPGTRDGDPGHPAGTHVNGYDMDVAYFQVKGSNNYLRPVCTHEAGGVEQYHCVAPPNNVDFARNALFLGALLTSTRVRVIGIDGQMGALMQPKIEELEAEGWLPSGVGKAAKSKLAYEITDEGRGWYQFHHHHQHISLKAQSAGSSGLTGVGTSEGASFELPSLLPTSPTSPAEARRLSVDWLRDHARTRGHAAIQAVIEDVSSPSAR